MTPDHHALILPDELLINGFNWPVLAVAAVLLPLAEIGDLSGIATRRVRRLVENGYIVGVRVGGRLRVPWCEVSRIRLLAAGPNFRIALRERKRP